MDPAMSAKLYPTVDLIELLVGRPWVLFFRRHPTVTDVAVLFAVIETRLEHVIYPFAYLAKYQPQSGEQ